ncbi:low temperature requirement protein A [Micromonospora thermarum]|uniref:Low temperature requirement protein A n=1 Tax=Micromonospora thermarum TaxID=2720024 RepID=A0ABX0Z3D4_9ACTN|nr:low temperature requirement protein A [Micromonospora thermarum]NJP32336.1 low temperature requirement protein A [Micromonospora thermarum]
MESVRGTPWPRGVQPSAPGSRATRLELFYDLVFVFAFLNVTTAVAGNPTVRGLVQGLLVLALLWWAWTGFAVLGNLVRTDQGVVPFVGFAATATAFVFALAMPKAFRELPGGLPGPLVFAVCYFLIRVSQVAVFGWMVRYERSRFRRLLPVAPVLVATGFLLVAAVLPQRFAEDRVEQVVRLALWLAAIGVEYGSGLVLPGTGWTVLSAGHWAERHALIILVALGETIIALGIGPGFITGLPLSWPIIIAALLGIAVVAALWWAYFDTLALASEQTLHRARVPGVRAALARDAYTYLHLVLVAGIILLALGLKGLLEEGADPSTPTWGLPLPGLDLLTLYGGVALYLLGLVALGLRVLGTVRWPSVTAVVLLAVLVPVAASLGEMLALSVLALATVTVVAVQTVVDAQLRRDVREVALREQVTAEADQTAWRGRHL